MKYVQEQAAITYFYGKRNVLADALSTVPLEVYKDATTDDHSITHMDQRWKHPFTCFVAGPNGCGKTTFVARLQRNASTIIDPSLERVTWYYGEWQSAYDNLDLPNLHLEEGLLTYVDASKRNIVVLGDLMAETDERVTNLFTKKKSHHCNISVIYIVQNQFPKIQGESHHQFDSQYIVVFKNPRDVSQMTALAKQVCPGRVKFVQEVFAEAWSTGGRGIRGSVGQRCGERGNVREGRSAP